MLGIVQKLLQEAFESRDREILQKALKEMDLDTAKYHMKRCEDAGLWNPAN